MIRSAPLAIELFAGTFDWGKGFVAAGYRVIGFDIEHLPHHGPVPDGCELVLQDVTTLHGRQFRNAAVIVASSPCQGYSARAMPWARLRDAMLLQHQGWEDDGGPPFQSAISNPPIDNTLFRATLRIHREACEAAGRYIPLLMENVKGAQRWIGAARWHYGSFYLWGDVPALMPMTSSRNVPGFNFHQHENGKPGGSFQQAAVAGLKYGDCNVSEGVKQGGRSMAWFDKALDQRRKQATVDGGKGFTTGLGLGHDWRQDPSARFNSKSSARKEASAQIAKIPFPLAFHIAQVYKP